MRQELLDHPYLRIDDRERAEERWRKERSKVVQEKLKALINLMNRGEVDQEIPSAVTGQRELTVDKFSSVHKPKLLNFGDDWLLIELERHPEGGISGPLHQFWLFSTAQKKLWLLPHTLEELSFTTGEAKVDNGDGVWRNPSDLKRSSFEKVLKNELGHKAAKEFFRAAGMETPPSLIECIPQEIDTLCEEITGIVPSTVEVTARTERETIYESKYGPVKGNGLSISLEGIKQFGHMERH